MGMAKAHQQAISTEGTTAGVISESTKNGCQYDRFKARGVRPIQASQDCGCGECIEALQTYDERYGTRHAEAMVA